MHRSEHRRVRSRRRFVGSSPPCDPTPSHTSEPAPNLCCREQNMQCVVGAIFRHVLGFSTRSGRNLNHCQRSTRLAAVLSAILVDVALKVAEIPSTAPIDQHNWAMQFTPTRFALSGRLNRLPRKTFWLYIAIGLKHFETVKYVRYAAARVNYRRIC